MENLKDFLEKVSTETGLRYDPTKNNLFGRFNNYHIVVDSFNNEFNIYTSIRKNGSMPNLNELKDAAALVSGITDVKLENNRFVFTASADSSEILIKEITDITNLLSDAGYYNACVKCGGREFSLSYLRPASNTIHLCTNCYNTVKGVSNLSDENKIHENVLAGIIGALIGSIIGAVVIILIGRMGYIASIGGALMAYCSVTGYEKLAKKLSLKGIFICIVIMFVTVFYANSIEWALEFCDSFNEYYSNEGKASFIAVLFNLKELIAEFGLGLEYIKDMLLLYMFTILGAFSTIRKGYQKSKMQQSSESSFC